AELVSASPATTHYSRGLRVKPAMTALLLSVFCFHFSFSIAQPSWPPIGMSGNGTSGNPWQITDTSHLRILADYVNAGNGSATEGKYYILMNDLDLSGYANWTPIGFLELGAANPLSPRHFGGDFDGNDKVVQNLTIYRPFERYIGLFGAVYYGTIQNLGIVNCNVMGKERVGGLAGGGSSSIINCFVTGNVADYSKSSFTGGLVGYSGYIANCYFIGNVTGMGCCGGLMGGGSSSTVINCYATGNVQGGCGVGGLIGTLQGGYGGEGGGYAPSIVSNCYAANSVQGEDLVGGLVGYMAYDHGLATPNNLVIRNCVAANDSVIGTGPINPFYGGGGRSSLVNRIVGCVYGAYGATVGMRLNNYALNTMVVQDGNGNVPIISHLDSASGLSIPMDSLKSFSFYDRAANWYQTAWSIQNPLGIWKICDRQDLPFLRYQGIICGDTIIATAGTNGTISPNGVVIVDEGNDQVFTFSADICYEIDSLWIDGVYELDSTAAGSYTFNNVIKNHTIEVSFKRLSPDTVTISDTICYGINYTQNGFSITNAITDSVYFNNDFNTNGCDSLTRLELTINPLIITQISDSICEGYFYDFRGDSLTASGIYYDTLPAISGCDSIIELTLTVHSIDTTQITVDICEGDSYDFFGRTLTEEGIYYETLQSIHGCDSVIELTLTVEGVGIVETRHATSLRIFPNPTDGKLIIESGELEIESVEIFDVVGCLVFMSAVSPQSPETTIDISHLATGMYFLKIDNKVIKIVKQ
ncbi:MAG: T9SS type A sorting domain-containing protein, partial [Lentimicrobiaceae bacterium]|nr:T9SS type A sorting domain-containing protein [Lentimicrobiaceae bacterium]